MTRLIIPFLLFSGLYSCNDPARIPNDVTFEISSEEPNEVLSKDNIVVQLNKKVDIATLEAIAKELRSTRANYDKLWIFYHVPELQNGMAWATSHFTPDLKISINGSTIEQDEDLTKAELPSGKVINKWKSEKSLAGGTLTLWEDSTGVKYMRIQFADSSPMDSELRETKENGKVRLDDDNSHGEYYILEDNGNLGMYSNDGKFDEAVVIQQ